MVTGIRAMTVKNAVKQSGNKTAHKANVKKESKQEVKEIDYTK